MLECRTAGLNVDLLHDWCLLPYCTQNGHFQCNRVLCSWSAVGKFSEFDRVQGSRSPKFGAEIRPHSQSQKVCFFPNSR